MKNTEKKNDNKVTNRSFAARVLAWVLIIAMVSATLLYIIILLGSK